MCFHRPEEFAANLHCAILCTFIAENLNWNERLVLGWCYSFYFTVLRKLAKRSLTIVLILVKARFSLPTLNM